MVQLRMKKNILRPGLDVEFHMCEYNLSLLSCLQAKKRSVTTLHRRYLNPHLKLKLIKMCDKNMPIDGFINESVFCAQSFEMDIV